MLAQRTRKQGDYKSIFIFIRSSNLENRGSIAAILCLLKTCKTVTVQEKCRTELIPTNPAMSRCPYPGGQTSNPLSEAPVTTSQPCQPRGGGRTREGRFPVERK